MSGGLPNTWANIIPLISFFLSFFNVSSTWSKSMCKLGNVTSTNTGLKPFWINGLIVVGKQTTGVINLAPGFKCNFLCFFSLCDFKALTINKLAELPELVSIPNSLPNFSANSNSNSLPFFPNISHSVNKLCTAALYSLLLK